MRNLFMPFAMLAIFLCSCSPSADQTTATPVAPDVVDVPQDAAEINRGENMEQQGNLNITDDEAERGVSMDKELKDSQDRVMFRRDYNKYPTDEQAIDERRRALNAKMQAEIWDSSLLRQVVRQIDAKKIGVGTLILERSPGIGLIEKMTYFIQYEDVRIYIDVTEIDWESDEMVMLVPGLETKHDLEIVDEIVRVGDNQTKVIEILRRFEKADTSKPPAELTYTMMWKVGPGLLAIEADKDTGELKRIAYVIGYEMERPARLDIRKIDLNNGEMTMIIPPPLGMEELMQH